MRFNARPLGLMTVVLGSFLIGCDGGGPGLEKPNVPVTNTPPDMSKMPGLLEMQDKMKKKPGATAPAAPAGAGAGAAAPAGGAAAAPAGGAAPAPAAK
jgi:hypothetical protein